MVESQMVIKQYIDMERKLLFVESSNPEERTILDGEYLSQDSIFIVPTNETETVQSIVRSICFQHFQNSMPVLAQKVIEFANHSLRMTFSLTLLRDILDLLSQQHSYLKTLKRYFQ